MISYISGIQLHGRRDNGSSRFHRVHNSSRQIVQHMRAVSDGGIEPLVDLQQ
jgi:hypothetical protein